MSEALHKPHRVLFLAKTACPCANAAGSLTTRTDADTGAVTLSTGHGIVTGLVDVSWDAGLRSAMDATVVGNACAIDGGTGDNLPAAATPVMVHQLGIYPAAAACEYAIIFQAPSLDVDELALTARQDWAPVQAYLRTARLLAEGTVVEVWLDRGLWLIIERPAEKARWIEFELAEDLGASSDYMTADILNFHDGTDPDPDPNPDAYAGTLTTRTADDEGVITPTADHGNGTPTQMDFILEGDHADVYWQSGGTWYNRKRMHVTEIDALGHTLTVHEGTGTALPAADTEVTVKRSFVVWNTQYMYSGYVGSVRGPRGTARLSPAKPAYTTPGPPRPSVAAQIEDRYYIDTIECVTANS